MGYLKIRSAFHYDDYKLKSLGKLFYWSNLSKPKYIPPKKFKSIDDALYWARLWEYKYFRNTRKYFNMGYNNGCM